MYAYIDIFIYLLSAIYTKKDKYRAAFFILFLQKLISIKIDIVDENILNEFIIKTILIYGFKMLSEI